MLVGGRAVGDSIAAAPRNRGTGAGRRARKVYERPYGKRR